MEDHGRVLGKLEEGVGWLKGEVSALRQDLKTEVSSLREDLKGDVSGLRVDVQDLSKFKAKVIGGAALLSVILTAVIELFHSKGN